MLRRFTLTLFSSWAMNPLGILVAQWFGVANSPTVILVLLATGACVPFQLLMNECMAASVGRGTAAPSRVQLAMVVLMQTLACAWAVSILAAQQFTLTDMALTVTALAVNTLMSYRATLMYYGLIMRDKVSLRNSVVIGAIPGITSLALYVMFCLASIRFAHAATFFIMATAVLPTLMQWRYLLHFRAMGSGEETCSPKLSFVATPWLLSAVIALAALAAISTHLRETIASLSANYVALLLVGLNSLLSLINTSTRAAFLSKGRGSLQKTLLIALLVALGLMVLSQSMQWSFSTVFALLAAQMVIAWVIEAARRMPAATRNPNLDSSQT